MITSFFFLPLVLWTCLSNSAVIEGEGRIFKIKYVKEVKSFIAE